MALFFYACSFLAISLKTRLIRRRAILLLLLPLIFSSSVFSNCIVSCRTSLNLSIGPSGFSVLTPGVLLVDPTCDPANFTVQIIDNFGMNLGDTIFCHQVGETIDAHVIETATGNSCNTSITIFDNLNPQITCSDTTMFCGQNFSPDIIGYPSVFDNCTDLTVSNLSYVDIPTNFSCLYIENGDTLNAKIDRRWTAYDENGNQGVCIQTIRLKKSFLSDVQLPPNHDGNQLPPIDCMDDPNDLNITGFPNIDGLALNASAFCDLAADYEDQVINICGAGYLIIRTWTLADWCMGEIDTHQQFIKVADTKAPEMICLQDFTVSTKVEDCNAIVTFPTTTATDDCSTVEITPTWQYGVGYGPFDNIPLGQYTITYTATDACGNSSSCEVIMTVADEIPPNNICKGSVQVNLGIDGTAPVPAATFDSGTYDNCSLKELMVARAGGDFNPEIVFNCEDIANSPVVVTMRAIDYYGNYNECDVYVTVMDQLPPEIECPDDITISCAADFLDASITGFPQVIDNCSLDTIFYEDQTNLNACDVGTITRTWTSIDAGGTSRQCTQLITLIDTTVLGISFPTDYTTSVCDPDLSPSVTGNPILTNDDCESIWIGFTDDTLSQAFPACFVIYRHWEIYEWCTYDAQTNTGFWEATQTIIVEDNVDPEIFVPNDTTVYSLADDCGPAYFNIHIASGSDCSNQVSITNNSIYADNNGADASGSYPPGIHIIIFEAFDNCGNSTSGQMTLTVLDGKAPTPICRSGLIFNLDQSGSITIDAAEINLASFDNCTDPDSLVLSLVPNTFTCDDVGTQLVSLIVLDQAGNSAVCETSVTIQDNLGNCPSGTISGNIQFWANGNGVNATALEISGASNGSVLSDLGGDYQFTDLPLNQNYSVEVFKSGNAADGISILDIVMLSRSIIGLSSMTNPYQLLAADVDRDNVLTVFDIVQMQKLILLIDTILPNSNSWRFVPEDYVFSNPLNPFADVIPEYTEINNLQSGETTAGFIGIKLGDVSGNTDVSKSVGGNSELRSIGQSDFNISNDEPLGISFRSKRNVATYGYQTTMMLEPGLEEVRVAFNHIGNNDYFYHATSGELRIMSYHPELIELSRADSVFEIMVKKGSGTNQKLNIRIKESKMVDKNARMADFDFNLSSH